MKNSRDPDAPPSADELAAAEELRASLEDAGRAHDDADLLRAIALAEHPRELDSATQEAAEHKALEKYDRIHARRARGVVIRVAFGVGVALAAAAALALFVGRPPEKPAAEIDLVHVRSTQELFSQRFEQGGESARIDRIAIARAADLRENRFARWGVRDGRPR